MSQIWGHLSSFGLFFFLRTAAHRCHLLFEICHSEALRACFMSSGKKNVTTWSVVEHQCDCVANCWIATPDMFTRGLAPPLTPAMWAREFHVYSIESYGCAFFSLCVAQSIHSCCMETCRGYELFTTSTMLMTVPFTGLHRDGNNSLPAVCLPSS